MSLSRPALRFSSMVGPAQDHSVMKHHVKTLSFPCRGIAVLFAALVCGIALSARAFEFDYWSKAIVTIPLSEQWEFGFEEWLSFTDNVARFKDSQTDLWLNYLGLADWLSVGAGYKRVFAKADDEWETEDRVMFNVAVKNRVYGFGVTNRSRFEYRMPQDEEVFWRYRHRVTITSPVTFTPLKILPYTAEEVFYSFDGEGFNQQRLYGGVFFPLRKNIRLELFYIWKLDKEDHEWHDTNVLGSWVYVQF
jgi:hypothetical protein